MKPTDTETPTLRAISLGGGVQSSVMTLMAAHGEFDQMPDAAIHADTGWEMPQTITMVEWLQATMPFPVHIVSNGNLRTELITGTVDGKDSKGFHQIPTHIIDNNGNLGMSRRQCTNQKKIRPIRNKAREIAGLAPRQRAETAGVTIHQWLGITTDEIHRVKQPAEKYIQHHYPLIDRDMTRNDCVDWWNDNAPPEAPPLGKSSCVGCPYHSSRQWAQLHDTEHVDDLEMIEGKMKEGKQNVRSVWLHARRIPIRQAIAADAIAIDQQPALFGNECDGYCGI